MTARAAPFFPVTLTGDGTTKTFSLGFSILAAAHVRVMLSGVLKVLGTDYAIQDITSDNPTIRFFTAPPASANNIKLYRNTPVALVSANPEISHIEARQGFMRNQEDLDRVMNLPFVANSTDTLAHTSQTIVAPCDGFVGPLQAEVTETIGTGGTMAVTIDGVAVTGIGAVIANSAAVGKVVRSSPTTAQASYTKAYKGQVIAITLPSFATSGALKGFIEFQPGDFT